VPTPEYKNARYTYGNRADLKEGETTQVPMPLDTRPPHEAPRAITAAEREVNAYETLRHAWKWHRDAGKRAVEEKKAAEEEAAKKK